MAWGQMVDMKKTLADKVEEVAEMVGGPTVAGVADYPYGLSISLTEEELEKLGLDDNCDIGDAIDIRAFAEVTSVTKREVNGKACCRVELQIKNMAVENEMTEEPGED